MLGGRETSFTVCGERIVCTAEEAFRCSMGTEIDILVCGSAILHSDQQDQKLTEAYRPI